MFNQQSVLNTDQLFVILRQVTEHIRDRTQDELTEYTYTHTDTHTHTFNE